MAPLPLKELKPFERISEKALPKPLRNAIIHIFQNVGRDVWLVGGTALAGFYAEHRRSDDIDLFVRDDVACQTSILAAKSLQNIGACLSNEIHTPLYYKASVELEKHKFNIDVVVDKNIHSIGKSVRTKDNIYVADIRTLFSQKIACLVSRASEKDLYDLSWLFKHVGIPDMSEFVQMGSLIDGGLCCESLLISLRGAILREEACHFSISNTKAAAKQIYRNVVALQKKLIRSLLDYEKTIPLSPDEKALRDSFQEIKKLKDG